MITGWYRRAQAFQDDESRYGHRDCHALTAAFMMLMPAGEAWGLYDTRYYDEIKHSVFRVPHTETFVDIHGAVTGMNALKEKAHEFVGFYFSEWRPMSGSELYRLVTGDKTRTIRMAIPVARRIIRETGV